MGRVIVRWIQLGRSVLVFDVAHRTYTITRSVVLNAVGCGRRKENSGVAANRQTTAQLRQPQSRPAQIEQGVGRNKQRFYVIGALEGKVKCDKCNGDNPISSWSNYCPKCRDEFQQKCADAYNGLSAERGSKAIVVTTKEMCAE